MAAFCVALCLAQDVRAQATPEQKAYAESQRQKREAAERKRADAEQKQRDNMERQRKQEEPQRWQQERQERVDAQRQQEWNRANNAIKEDRSGANIGTPQSLSGSAGRR
jgi:Mg-chelatase subunit ChlI